MGRGLIGLFLLGAMLLSMDVFATAHGEGLNPLETERYLRLPNGDWLVYRFHPTADSGVKLFRMDSNVSKERWRTTCKPLGVEHSKYNHHVQVTLEKEVLKVVSKGNGGSFEEWIDVSSGKQNRRKEYKVQ